jgi:hypothetical protein
VLLRLVLHAHLRSAQGGSARDQRRAEIEQWWWRRKQ